VEANVVVRIVAVPLAVNRNVAVAAVAVAAVAAVAVAK